MQLEGIAATPDSRPRSWPWPG